MTCLLCSLLGAGVTVAVIVGVLYLFAWLEPHAAPRDTDQSMQ